MVVILKVVWTITVIKKLAIVNVSKTLKVVIVQVVLLNIMTFLNVMVSLFQFLHTNIPYEISVKSL